MPNEVIDPELEQPTGANPVPDEPQVLAEAAEQIPFPPEPEPEYVPEGPPPDKLDEIAGDVAVVRRILEHFEHEFFKPKAAPRRRKAAKKSRR